MIHTMLVLLAGDSVDASVCSTAVAVGRKLQAHLECYHPSFPAAEVALARPSAGFAMGSAVVAEMLDEIDEQSERRSEAARGCFIDLCRSERISVVSVPRSGLFSAGWTEQAVTSVDAVIRSARYRDLVVAGRSRSSFGLCSDFLERLVLGCGRPVLVAPERASCPEPKTIMVWWNESPQAAHALAAALPLLIKAKRVIVTAAREGSGMPQALSELVDELCLHGIAAEADMLPERRGSIAHQLFEAADEKAADLIVLGAYGHSRAGEIMFGGVTQTVLASAEVPVLLMH